MRTFTSTFSRMDRHAAPGRRSSLRIPHLFLAPALVFAVACSDGSLTTSIEVDSQRSAYPALDPSVMAALKASTSTFSLGGPQASHGSGIVANGSFESGFAGWSTSIVPNAPLVPWTISGAGAGSGFGMATTAPQDGSLVAWNGFDGGGPLNYDLWQDVDLPMCTLELGWQDRFQWLYGGYGGVATVPREAFVEVRNPADDAVLATVSSFSTGTQAENPTGDTGWLSHAVDLSAFGGTSARLSFRQYIPQNFTGPGQFEIDHVTVRIVDTAPVAMAELVPVDGKSLKSKKGTFTVHFSCSDTCDDDAVTSATLNGIEVENGQVVELQLKSRKSAKDAKSKKAKSRKPLKLGDSSFELVVVCTDPAGNQGMATASPEFAEKKGKK